MDKKTYQVNKSFLLGATTPVQTRTYKPVLHEQLIDLTLSGIEKAGFKLDRESYSAAKEGQIANGRFTIKNVADTEMQLEIGWQNSYNKQLSLKWAIGTKIFICQNGSVSSDYGNFKKKHSGEVQTFTPHAITEYIKRAADIFATMQKERDVMKTIELTDRVKAELLGRMFIEEQFIQSTQLNIIKNELKTPTHDYGAENSMWELYNFTTFAMKEVHPSLWMENHIDAHDFFTTQSGIIVPKSPQITLETMNQLELFEQEVVIE